MKTYDKPIKYTSSEVIKVLWSAELETLSRRIESFTLRLSDGLEEIERSYQMEYDAWKCYEEYFNKCIEYKPIHKINNRYYSTEGLLDKLQHGPISPDEFEAEYLELIDIAKFILEEKKQKENKQ